MIWIRVAIAVLLGFLLMWLSYGVTMVAAVDLVNPDRLRDPQTGIMTNWFIFMVQFPVVLFTAVIGGVVAALLAGRTGQMQAIKGLVWLAIIAGMIGVVGGYGVGLADEIGSGSQSQSGGVVDDSGSTEVAVGPSVKPPIPPTWNVLLLPFVRALGVLLGGRFVVRVTESLSPTPGSSIPPMPPSSESPNA